MTNSDTKPAVARIPYELWSEVLRYSAETPIGLMRLATSFAPKDGAKAAPLAQLALVAEDQFCKAAPSFVEPSKLQEHRARVADAQARGLPEPPSIVAEYKQRFEQRPLAERREMVAAFAGRTLPSSSQKIADFEFAAALLSPNQIAHGAEVAKGLLPALKDNKELALMALDNDGRSFAYFSERVRLDEDVAQKALIRWPRVGQKDEFNDEFLGQNDVLLGAMRHNNILVRYWIDTFEDLPSDLQTAEIRELLAFVRRFESAEFRLQDESFVNKSKVLLLALLDPYSLSKIRFDATWAQDAKFIRKLFESIGRCPTWPVCELNFLAPHLRQNKQQVLLGLRHGIDAAQVIGNFDDDLDIALGAAMNSRGNGYTCLSGRLRAHKRVAREFVRAHAPQWDLIPHSLQQDDDIAFALLGHSRAHLRKVSKELRSNRNFIRSVIEEWPDSIIYVDDPWKKDAEMVALSARQSFWYLSHCDAKFFGDEDFLVSLMRKGDQFRNSLILSLADEPLRNAKARILWRGEGHSPLRARMLVWQKTLFCVTKHVACLLTQPVRLLLYMQARVRDGHSFQFSYEETCRINEIWAWRQPMSNFNSINYILRNQGLL